MRNDLPSPAAKTRGMLTLEQSLGEPLEATLRRLYYDDNLTLYDISERLGLRSPSTVWRWMRKLGIAAKQLQPPAGRTA